MKLEVGLPGSSCQGFNTQHVTLFVFNIFMHCSQPLVGCNGAYTPLYGSKLVIQSDVAAVSLC
jgi:hypothetical protein